ncbi:hypothetical protein MAR_011122 [Mya arenaria]|uniref:Uncharacterized protein n=1 Tax=Mya arenaria TaxID=6604 RepID=A0ABY7FX12_MYAAR|nr:hypothetical protein MAR_011122 [Mya arenaria]
MSYYRIQGSLVSDLSDNNCTTDQNNNNESLLKLLEDSDDTESYYDDDVRDPDWNPVNSAISDTEEIQIDHEEIIESEQDNNGAVKRSSINLKELNKSKRMKGEKYLGVQKNTDGVKTYCVERKERLISPSNGTKRCEKSRQCSLLQEEDRQAIFETFWHQMTWQEKRLYVTGLIERREVAQRTTEGNSRRNFSYKYYLRNGHLRVQVCKNLFTATLGLSEKTVLNWTNEATFAVPKPEGQRRKGVNTEFATRRDTAREYFLNQLYNEYQKDCKEKGTTPYHKTGFIEMFKDMNLSLWQPKKDQCDKCCEHKANNLDEDIYQAHILKKNEAREAKQADKEKAKHDSTTKLFTIDLQSLLVCPKLNASSLYYKMKLSCHNFTIYDMTTASATNYFWHEGEGKLNANCFASCLVDYLETLDLSIVKTIIIYSCGAKVTDIRVLKYNTDGSIAYKLNHSDEFGDIPKPRSSRVANPSISDRVENLYSHRLSIRKQKYEHLQQLKSVIPRDYHSFYDTLLHTKT